MSTNKPVLFFDFDGFKFDTLGIHVEYINQTYGIKTTADDYIDNPRLELVIQKYLSEDQHHLITNEKVYAVIGINLLSSIEWHDKVLPIEGMAEVIPLLARKYQLWTVTARHDGSMKAIWHLLDKHVPNCISGIHCVWKYLGGEAFSSYSKRDFISNFQGEKIAFIDDSTKEILEMGDVVPSYLFDPHGIHDHVPGIQHRVRSWKEIGELFL